MLTVMIIILLTIIVFMMLVAEMKIDALVMKTKYNSAEL
jgi:hypothetical protein